MAKNVEGIEWFCHMYCLHSHSSFHYDNTPLQYNVIFHGCKNGNFQIKHWNDIFHIFAKKKKTTEVVRTNL